MAAMVPPGLSLMCLLLHVVLSGDTVAARHQL